MNKEYREMTAEERIRVIKAAMNNDGFVELKRIIDEYELILTIKETPSMHITDKNIEPIRKIINKEGLAGFADTPKEYHRHNTEEETSRINVTSNLEQGSIYASEHRDLAMEENQVGQTIAETTSLEQQKRRVLEPVTPNPWGDAEVVSPGTIKL